MVQTTRSGVGRGNLAQRGGDDQCVRAANQPANGEGKRAAAGQRNREGPETAGQDANDGKGNRKILESAHASVQFLGVAHSVQDFFVF